MPRILLTAPTDFYAGAGGSNGNDGSSPAQALPTLSDVIQRLQQSYDLGGQVATVHLIDGSYDPGFRISGILVGQKGFGGLCVKGDTFGASYIRPSGGSAAIMLDSGAMCSIAELSMDLAFQGPTTPQDCVQIGQGSRLAIYGNNRLIQNSSGVNGFSIGMDCSVDIMPQSWGSPTQNGGHLHIQGLYQDFIQTDQGGNFCANCNGGHGLIGFWMEAYAGLYPEPRWGVAFADVAAGVILLSGVDFHGTGAGYRFRRRKGGTLDLNVAEGDPGQLAALPGSAYEYPIVPPGVSIISGPLSSAPNPFNGQGWLI